MKGGNEARPLEDFRYETAYVLLGDPGAGKTTAFRREYEALGEDRAEFLTARRFLRVDLGNHPDWKDKVLFIDGLDEVRAGQDDARSSIDIVISRLDALGKPRFRLSCRAADWLGSNDLSNLSVASPEDGVKVLHLAPLTSDDIRMILQSCLVGTYAEAFLPAAYESGLSGLLTNPQTLDMLISLANRGEVFPESRRLTFEKFCSLLAEEQNEEHQIGLPDVSTGELLGAAGRLCAVQLLAGASGYMAGHAKPDEGYLKLDQAECEDRSLLRSPLSTRLFSSAGKSLFAPAHRHIAEFLAARYLAGVIADGLPAKRVISLMAGGDGIVVTELRGLSAWLAANCPVARRPLIDGDPIGVCLYGDIHDFSPNEKRQLLDSLKRRTASLNVDLPSGAARSLTSSDMVPAILEALEDATRTEEHDKTTLFLLDILKQGLPSQEFSGVLFNIVLDSRRGSDIQRGALRAFLHNSEDLPERTEKLRKLLACIRSGSLRDPDRWILDVVLTELYPHVLSPSEVWDYLPEIGGLGSPMQYLGFWHRHLTVNVSPEQVGALIRGLTDRMPTILDVMDRQHMSEVPLRVLQQALCMRGDSVSTTVLYEWLDLAKRTRWRVHEGEPSLNTIRAWLEKRPAVQKCLMLEALSRSSGYTDVWDWVSDAKARLCDAARPSDYGLWCLEQAVNLVAGEPWTAESLLQEAFVHRSQNRESGLSLDDMRTRIEGYDVLESRLERLINPPPLPTEHLRMQQWKTERELEEAMELNYLRSQQEALRDNRASPVILHQLAEVYFGQQIGSDRITGRGALESFLKGDQGLLQSALTGLAKTSDRSDIPSVSEILNLRAQNRMHYLNPPFLASMDILNASVPPDLSEREAGMYRTALMFYYCGFVMGEYTPKWYAQLLTLYPGIVADVQLQFTRAEFRRGGEHIDGLFQLAHDPSHAEVASSISIPLLRAFPTRGKAGHPGPLRYLLWAAIQYADRESLRILIAGKVALKSTTVAQRAQWIAAGLVTSPEKFGDLAVDFAAGSYQRSRHVADFFDGGRYFRSDKLLTHVGIRTAKIDYQYNRSPLWTGPAVRAR